MGIICETCKDVLILLIYKQAYLHTSAVFRERGYLPFHVLVTFCRNSSPSPALFSYKTKPFTVFVRYLFIPTKKWSLG